MKTRIVITDDQPDLRKLVRMTLDIGDYEIYEASNGSAALEIIGRVKPQIVLMDIMMPGEIDGLEVCRRIKDDPALSDTVVIMLTARGQQSDLIAGKAAGADDYLVKPFSPLELLSLVGKLLNKS